MPYLRILAILAVLSPIGAAVQAEKTVTPVDPALSSIFQAPTVCPAVPEGTSTTGLVDPATLGQIVSAWSPRPVPLVCQCNSASQCPRCPPPSQRVCINRCICDCT
jgi:hypothetical protein